LLVLMCSIIMFWILIIILSSGVRGILLYTLLFRINVRVLQFYGFVPVFYLLVLGVSGCLRFPDWRN
jgi:hypothetical protein